MLTTQTISRRRRIFFYREAVYLAKYKLFQKEKIKYTVSNYHIYNLFISN